MIIVRLHRLFTQQARGGDNAGVWREQAFNDVLDRR